MEKHSILDDKVHVYKRPGSRFWQCSTYISGANHRVSTKEENLNLAIDFAREWYMAVYVEAKKMARGDRLDTLVKRFRGEDHAGTEPSPAHMPAPYHSAR